MEEDPRMEALQLETRRRIYDAIQQAPGLHFREIQRRTGLAIGSLQYHLDVLLKEHLIKMKKEGKFSRFFLVVGEQTEDEKVLLSLLRQRSVRQIILYLLDRKKASNKRLAKEVQLSPSTVSFHLQKLLESRLVEKTRKGKKTFFLLTNPELARKLLTEYKESFVDELVNNFVDIWEKMEIPLTPSSSPKNVSG